MKRSLDSKSITQVDSKKIKVTPKIDSIPTGRVETRKVIYQKFLINAKISLLN